MRDSQSQIKSASNRPCEVVRLSASGLGMQEHVGQHTQIERLLAPGNMEIALWQVAPVIAGGEHEWNIATREHIGDRIDVVVTQPDVQYGGIQFGRVFERGQSIL